MLEVTWVAFLLKTIQEKDKMGTADTKNHCERLTVGGEDCKNQIRKEKCSGLLGNECGGRIGGAGADMPKAKQLVEAQKKLIAVRKLEEYRSTGEGLGHLSNKRAVHASAVPFH